MVSILLHSGCRQSWHVGDIWAAQPSANSNQVEKEREKELRKARQGYIAQEYKDQVAANSKISKYVQQGADTQKKIYEKLIKDKGKLDTQDLKATQKSADKKYRAAVEPAKKTRDEVVKNKQMDMNMNEVSLSLLV